MGYGARTLQLLAEYYQGQVPNLSEDDDDHESSSQGANGITADGEADLLHELPRARKDLPPLLLKLSERRAERLHWLGVSYGLTTELLKFWKRAGYSPVYLRQTQVCPRQCGLMQVE